jgi:predicted transcriptional regulator
MTMANRIEYDQARRLRQEGMSIKRIAKTLGVSLSSVSTWVRDIVLSDDQLAEIKRRQYTFDVGQHKGSQANMVKHREIRRQYQEEGRRKARERDPLHIAGCMLYWAEGTKDRNSLEFVNSDPDMMQYYMRFLRESLSVEDDSMSASVICYTGNGLSIEEIEDYWLSLLNLPRTSLRKTIVNVRPSSSEQKGRKLLYGLCKICVHRCRFMQHVYGAIQEYTGIDKPEWLR